MLDWVAVAVCAGSEKKQDKTKQSPLTSPTSAHAQGGRMLLGKVVTFHNGMGSIIASSGTSYFFYATDMQETDHPLRRVSVGDRVKFEPSENRKGLLAKRLIFLS